MRVLLDECVNPRVRYAFSKHEVRTVREMGWGGITNGKLMVLAQQGFDIFVTVDQNLEHQQNVAKLMLGLIIVAVPDNNIKYFTPVFAELQKSAESVRPGKSSTSSAPNCEPDALSNPQFTILRTRFCNSGKSRERASALSGFPDKDSVLKGTPAKSAGPGCATVVTSGARSLILF